MEAVECFIWWLLGKAVKLKGCGMMLESMNRSIPKYYKPVLVMGIRVTIDQLLDLPIFMLR